MYPRRLQTFSEHFLMSFVQSLINGHADSGIPVNLALMGQRSSRCMYNDFSNHIQFTQGIIYRGPLLITTPVMQRPLPCCVLP